MSPWHIWCVAVFDSSSPLSLATPCVSFPLKTSPLMQFERTFHCRRWRLSGERSDLLLNRTPGTGRSPEVRSLKQRDPGARQRGAKERGPALASGLGFSLVSPCPFHSGIRAFLTCLLEEFERHSWTHSKALSDQWLVGLLLLLSQRCALY